MQTRSKAVLKSNHWNDLDDLNFIIKENAPWRGCENTIAPSDSFLLRAFHNIAAWKNVLLTVQP